MRRMRGAQQRKDTKRQYIELEYIVVEEYKGRRGKGTKVKAELEGRGRKEACKQERNNDCVRFGEHWLFVEAMLLFVVPRERPLRRECVGLEVDNSHYKR